MKIFFNKNKLIKVTKNEKKLGFVPTMGAIHKGHLSLIKNSQRKCQKTLVSIFVNKPQFNKKNDFQKYPRTIQRDILLLKKNRVNYLFIPSMKQMYPNGVNRNIKIIPFAKKLCGRSRPNHFESIADVIDRFIKIVKPKKIFFGEKDMQQLKIIESFVKYKYPEIKVVGCKTIREKNGVALSSRNSLLSSVEMIKASNTYKFIKFNKKKIINYKMNIRLIKKKILSFGIKKIDYIKILDINKITKPYHKRNKYRIFIAYYIGSVRLIDNI